MLPGLGHDAFVGGDDQGHQVDPPGAGHHVPDEFLVAGHVHDPQEHPGRQREVGKPQLDGDAPLLFFLQPVGIDAGERLNQRRLAVVDVPGGAEDESLHATS